jgi:very-short-patch-repair endonuclease
MIGSHPLSLGLVAARRAARPSSNQSLSWQCTAAGLPDPLEEYRFHPARRWRFDLAWPAHKVAVEIDGGTFSGGRHVSGVGHARDSEKANEAQLLGWVVLRVIPDWVRDGRALALVERALALQEGP